MSGNLDIMIFLTGVGAKFLISEAESIGLKDPFLGALEKITVVVRGPKPVAALRQFGPRRLQRAGRSSGDPTRLRSR